MLAWVLNTPLLFEDSLNIYFFKVFYIIRFLKSAISLKYFTSFDSSNIIKHRIIKPFDLLNTIPLTRTKTLVNNLLMRNF